MREADEINRRVRDRQEKDFERFRDAAHQAERDRDLKYQEQRLHLGLSVVRGMPNRLGLRRVKSKISFKAAGKRFCKGKSTEQLVIESSLTTKNVLHEIDGSPSYRIIKDADNQTSCVIGSGI